MTRHKFTGPIAFTVAIAGRIVLAWDATGASVNGMADFDAAHSPGGRSASTGRSSNAIRSENLGDMKRSCAASPDTLRS